MSQVRTNTTAVKQLEDRLVNQKNKNQRLLLLDRLAEHFMFTNYKKALTYLSEMKSILNESPNQDFLFNFHLFTAFIENQLYNYHLADIHLKKAIHIVEEWGEVHQQIDTYIDYAGICINLDQHQDVTIYLDKAAKLLESFPDKRLEARLVCRQGMQQLHYRDSERAISMLLEADRIIDRLPVKLTLKDYYFRTIIHSGLGRIYQDNGQIDKSISAYLRVVKWCESLGMQTRLSWHYLNVGNGYTANQDDLRAKKYFRKAIKITDDISQNARAGAYANLGYIYFKEEKYDEALELYERAEYLYREKPRRNLVNFSIIDCRRAQLYAKLGKNSKAQKYFVSAIENGKQSKDDLQTATVCQEVASYHASIDDYRNAYDFQVLHDHMLGRHNDTVRDRTRIEVEVKYEAEKKIHEAEVLRLEADGLKLKALRAQMNPHFLFNALNSIQTFITSDESGIAAKYLAKFALLMRQSLEYSDVETISLEKEINFLENYLYINQKLRFQSKLNYTIEIHDDIEEDIMAIPTMIVQPYLENAIEHGLRAVTEGQLKLSYALHDENTILCVVQDNGVGRAKAAELRKADPIPNHHKSMGTSITEQRLEILNKIQNDRVKVKTIDLTDPETGRATGTRVEIFLPIDTIQA